MAFLTIPFKNIFLWIIYDKACYDILWVTVSKLICDIAWHFLAYYNMTFYDILMADWHFIVILSQDIFIQQFMAYDLKKFRAYYTMTFFMTFYQHTIL